MKTTNLHTDQIFTLKTQLKGALRTIRLIRTRLGLPLVSFDGGHDLCECLDALVSKHQRSITSPRFGYHCTTAKKLENYIRSKRIIAPVRFWPDLELAKNWAKRTHRKIILRVELEDISYPLPDHKPAMWCGRDVINFYTIDT